jgi:DNA-binding HxlR family transcriptional regulator
MATRSYGQGDGLARAVELVGERWALLIVRDLVRGPKRYTDLRRGLPRVPTSVLSLRLRELEGDGIIRRRVLPRPSMSVVYELTDYGRDLEDIVLRLGRWGARSRREPKPEDILTEDALILALRSTFHPEAAWQVYATFELHVANIVVHVRVENGSILTGEGPPAAPDLVIHADDALRELMAGELTPRTAVELRRVSLIGEPALLERFVELFRIQPERA